MRWKKRTMVSSLEEYVAQATKAYQPASNAIQSQLDALSGKLETTNQAINKNYAQQQATLNRNRNSAAESASLQAAGSGGSFGGAANIANRKYYEQSFVPAQTQLQTNQANELAQARQNSENERTNLNSQLAQLQAQANQQALQQYYSDLQLEKQLAEQRRASASQDAYYKYLMDAMSNSGDTSQAAGYYLQDTKNKYGGYNWVDANGNAHTAGTVAAAVGGDFTSALANVLSMAAGRDSYSNNVLNEISKGYKFAKNTGGSTGNIWYDTLGIKKVYDPYATATKTATVARTNPSTVTRGYIQTNGRNR